MKLELKVIDGLTPENEVLLYTSVAVLQEAGWSLVTMSPQDGSIILINTPQMIPRNENPRNGVEFMVRSRMEWLLPELERMYKRPNHHGRSYAEESMLMEVCRRSDVKSEFSEIQNYQQRLPAKERKYFPQSLSRLLSMWEDILDRARVYSPNPRDRTLLDKEIDLLVAGVKKDFPDPE